MEREQTFTISKAVINKLASIDQEIYDILRENIPNAFQPKFQKCVLCTVDKSKDIALIERDVINTTLFQIVVEDKQRAFIIPKKANCDTVILYLKTGMITKYYQDNSIISGEIQQILEFLKGGE